MIFLMTHIEENINSFAIELIVDYFDTMNKHQAQFNMIAHDSKI